MGLIDDRAWAEAQAGGLRRRGASARAVAARLSSKGAPRAEIERLLAGEDDAAEREAARALARRRRLGPWRGPAERAARRQKDLAALARAGFSVRTWPGRLSTRTARPAAGFNRERLPFTTVRCSTRRSRSMSKLATCAVQQAAIVPEHEGRPCAIGACR